MTVNKTQNGSLTEVALSDCMLSSFVVIYIIALALITNGVINAILLLLRKHAALQHEKHDRE